MSGSHQVKHWLCDHPELLTPPRFKFSLIRLFQDPLSRELSEAVRIELRGENVLNSKAEFSRCRVPRLRVDLEGWMTKKAEEKSKEKPSMMGSIPQEEEKVDQ